MGITVIIGDKGSGKTLLMTHLLHQAYIKENKKIISNYGLKFPHEKLYVSNLKYHREDIKNACVGIDEAPIFIDSRRSQSELNLVISYFLMQSRKRSVDVYLTAQRFNTLDRRLRDNCDSVIHCKPVKIVGDNGNRQEVWIDGCQQTPDILYLKEYDNTKTPMQIKKFRWEIIKEDFSLYDTDEIIDIGARQTAYEPALSPKKRWEILKRDNKHCRIRTCQNSGKVEVHHIFERIEEQNRNEDDNLITLCIKHHGMARYLEDGISDSKYQKDKPFYDSYRSTIKFISKKELSLVFDGEKWRINNAGKPYVEGM